MRGLASPITGLGDIGGKAHPGRRALDEPVGKAAASDRSVTDSTSWTSVPTSLPIPSGSEANGRAYRLRLSAFPSVTKPKNVRLTARSYSARRSASALRASSSGVGSAGPEKRSSI